MKANIVTHEIVEFNVKTIASEDNQYLVLMQRFSSDFPLTMEIPKDVDKVMDGNSHRYRVRSCQIYLQMDCMMLQD